MNGLKIHSVAKASLAELAGVRNGEILLSINGSPLRDELDLAFLQSDENLVLHLLDPSGTERHLNVRKQFDADLGITVDSMAVHHCNSRCVFCFVDQNPPGLRPALYVKDADFRLSFLYGNYITTNELREADIQRIIEQRLFPLYLSVHTTNDELRLRMLGITRGPSILQRMRFFAEHGIQMHAQIVLCPGWNDGEEFDRTIRDLAQLGPALLSIAVVPVGLTCFRTNLAALHPVTAEIAQGILQQGAHLRSEIALKCDREFLFFSDEFYLLANEPVPDYSQVEILHQLENGVGMIYQFYSAFHQCELPSHLNRTFRVAMLTGMLGAKALESFIERMSSVHNLHVDVIPIQNTLFGPGVTVSGLLSGRDFQHAINTHPDYNLYMIPHNSLRAEDNLFLDDLPASSLHSPDGSDIALVDGDAVDAAEVILDQAS